MTLCATRGKTPCCFVDQFCWHYAGSAAVCFAVSAMILMVEASQAHNEKSMINLKTEICYKPALSRRAN